jgi:hypothetical protein
MTLILSGTDGLSDVDGSAATPAIRGTDANTGIFFPAADTIAFAEGGVESMRIDASGNVGIGRTPSAFVAGSKGLQVGTYTSIMEATGGDSNITSNSYLSAASTYSSILTAAASRYMLDFGSHRWLVAPSVSAGSVQTFTTAMTLDSSGNLLVGTTSNYGGRRLDLRGSNTDYLATFTNSNASPAGLQIYYTGAAPNGTGSVFFNCLDTVGTKAEFRSNGGLANYSANNVNLSDRREKTNFAPATSYLDKICAIPVQTFNYIDQNLEEDAGLTLGVVAQDVQAVAPEMVMESNWGTEEEPKMRLSIYQTDLQYALMKCIQEQQAIITTLTDRITALENK